MFDSIDYHKLSLCVLYFFLNFICASLFMDTYLSVLPQKNNKFSSKNVVKTVSLVRLFRYQATPVKGLHLDDDEL